MQKDQTVTFCDPEISSTDFSGKLIGFIEHNGASVTTGHYKNVVNCGNTWFHCDDALISKKDPDMNFNSNKCYILFYLKQVSS